MEEKLNIHLTNWHCFDDQKFSVPLQSAIIHDQNGSGKTTLISAIYSLMTGQPWPETKFKNSIRADSEYFGLSTDKKDWFLTGKFSTNGRMTTRYSKLKPETLQNIKTLTYLPDDNRWFFESRTKRLGILDNLLVQIYGQEYQEALRKLNKAVQNKQKLIKHTQELEAEADPALVITFNRSIENYSKKVWKTRQKFLKKLNEILPDFNSWINSPLKNWKIDWEISDQKGVKHFAKIEEDFISKIDYSDQDFLNLWQKEIMIGKVMFGAQRDDFKIISNHSEIQNVLSRGEMRSFVLFIKNLAREILKDYKIIWLMDDVFNELDSQREKTIFQKILKKTDVFIATGTKKPKFFKEIEVYRLDDLKI